MSATRLGMMKGTLDEGLPSASVTRPKGSLSWMTKVFASGVSYLSTALASWPPKVSRLAQRLSEATTSSLVTGLPS